MDKTKIVEVQGRLFKLNVPNFRHQILIKSLFAQLTRGNAALMQFSGSDDQTKALNLAETLAELDVLVTPLKVENGEQVPDFDFQFQSLDVDEISLVEEVAKELGDFIDSFRKAKSSNNSKSA